MADLDDEELLRVKPFDWASASGFGEIMAAGGFDAVIGNPPYVRIQTMKETAPETVPVLQAELRFGVKRQLRYLCTVY